MKPSQILILTVALAAVVAFFAVDGPAYLTLDNLRANQGRLADVVASYPAASRLAFFALYVAITAVSLPGAAILTLAAGATFGLWWGLLVVSFASTIGATLAMVLSRYLFQDLVQNRFASQLELVNEGMAREGAFYLFTLRLVPAVPFFVINLVMGLTRIKVWVFFIVSQVGMLAGTVVYVNAGTQLGRVTSVGDVLSPGLIASFVLLGFFPLLAKWSLAGLRRRRQLARFARPRQFDRDVVVIGAGSGGLVAAYIAAMVKAKVTLIEKSQMGGDCLNTGCVPSKSLIRSAKFAADLKRSQTLGFRDLRGMLDEHMDFAEVMARIRRVIGTVAPHDSVERYTELGVDVAIGEAYIKSPYEVDVNGRTLTTRSIILATGAEPVVPPIPGLDRVDYVTSDSVWGLEELPERLVVVGGGPIGTELSQSFARLGSRVTQVEMGPTIMSREDSDVVDLVRRQMVADGVDIRTDCTPLEVLADGATNRLVIESVTGREEIPFDRLLLAVGRKAHTIGFGLEELGLDLTARGTVAVDPYLRTSIPNIYAVGDVAGPYQFTHTASHQAWYAAVNALFGTFKKFKVDYRVIPWCTFSSPEVARVGLNEKDAEAAGIPFEVTRYDVAEADRAIADEEAKGMVKVLTAPGKDRILGVTIAGSHAGDLLAEYVLAMKHGIGLNKILSTIHIYPTLAEVNKLAAGEWRRNHKPEWLLDIAAKFHRWRRGGSQRFPWKTELGDVG